MGVSDDILLRRRKMLSENIKTPYSRKATMLLTAQFPEAWTIIRKYGFEHPEIVPYINEDPMVVCSLGLSVEGVTMPIRHLYGNGSAYINIGIYSKDFDTFEMGMLVTNTSQFTNVEGCRETGSAAYSWCRFSGGLIEPWFRGSVGNTPVIANKPFVFKMLAKVGEQKGYIDDVLKFQNMASVPYIDGQVSVHYAFAMNNNPGPANYFTGYGSKVAYIKDGADVVRLIPYYDKINKKMQWLDLVSGNYAEIYGTFTEAFYLPDGTPWTPLNQQ